MITNEKRRESVVTLSFRQLISEYTNSVTARNYQNFLSSFEKFLGDRLLDFSDVNKELIAAYRAWLVNSGNRPTYITLYLQYFRSLYNKAYHKGLAPKTSAFDDVHSTKPKAVGECSRLSGVFVVRELANLSLTDKPSFSRVRDLFLFSVLSGGLSYRELCSLRKTDLRSGYLYIQSPTRQQKLLSGMLQIIEKYRQFDTDYLFALDQEKTEIEKSEHQYYKRLEALFHLASCPNLPIHDHTALSLYISIAMELGIEASSIRGCVSHLPTGSALELVDRRELSQSRIDQISEQVAYAIKDYRSHWYSLRLYRPVEEIQSYLAEENIESYYPIEEVARRVGKKIEDYKSPVMKHVLFFRSTEEKSKKIARDLFGQVSIYKSLSSEQDRYAIIPDYEMYMFRMLVSNGSEEIRFEEIDKRDFSKGKRVRIIEGKFCGYEGVVVKKKGSNVILVNLCNVQFSVTAGIPDVCLQLI